MNLIDLMLLIIIAVCVVFDMYRGFMVSAYRMGAFIISTLSGMILAPVLSWIFGTQGILNTLIGYTEGSLKIAEIETANLPVSSLQSGQINDIVQSSSVVSPFNRLIVGNVNSQAFANQGLTTVGEYFDYTVAHATLHIICFIVVFLLVRIVLGILINSADGIYGFPVLKTHDTMLAGLCGLVRGICNCYVLFTLLPIVLSVLNITIITDYVSASFFGSFFYKTNIILALVGGT